MFTQNESPIRGNARWAGAGAGNEGESGKVGRIGLIVDATALQR